MKDRTRDAMIGLCAIAAIGSFITILQLFGELPGPPTWRMTFMTRSTSGLADNSKVQLDGVPIGTIESVELSGNPDWPVRITTRIDEAIEIPLSVVPLTTTSLLTGAANLYLESAVTPGDSGVFLRDGSAVMNCEIQSAAIRDIVNAIDRRVGPALSAIGGLAPLLGSSGDSEFPGIPDLVREANKTVQAVREWVEDPTLRKQADEAMHLALAALDRAITAIESFDALIDTTTTVMESDIASAGRSLSEAMHRVAAVMSTMEEGEGTAGQLLTNPDLYNSLAASATQLERLAQSMRLMVDQIREEGVGPLISP